ncbi:MAG: HAMP domain-containing protein, partial [Desulfuromonadales bacterium]|nr:HAMP domain-containing protein [Desulfuromonadales bacterium]
EYISQILAGNEVSDVFADSKGKLAIVDASPLEIAGLKWGMVSKIDLEEALVTTLDGESQDYFTKYVEQYGYYDLLLINSTGEVFYSVSKEADYHTNMIDGKFSKSGLGKLTRQVKQSQQYGVADFEPYEPSNGEPAAFIAQPFMDGNEVELIVALQLSLDSINAIMTQRAGMGETGETYLVGPDKLMRSDSFLDAVNHTVAASFANPAKGDVDTDASRAALGGKTGNEIIEDYNGNPVLSAYTPVKIDGLNWAMIAEIDESEAFAAVTAIKWLMVIIGVIGIVAIVFVSLMIARSITKPVIKGVTLAEKIALGDFTARINLQREDEIGQLGRSLDKMADSLQGQADIAEEIAKGNLDVEVKL